MPTIVDLDEPETAITGPSHDWRARFIAWRNQQPEFKAFSSAVTAGADAQELRKLGAAAGLSMNEIAEARQSFHITKDDREIVARHYEIVAAREVLRVERESLTKQLASNRLSRDETEALEKRLCEVLVEDRQLVADGALPRLAWKRLGKPAK